MSSLLGRLGNLPLPLKIAIALASGGSVIAVLLAYWSKPRILLILAAGIAVVLVLLFLYAKILRLGRKRRGHSLGKEVLANSEGGLRQRFSEGIDKFRQHGQDLYSVPWYLLVGESGSGKTEAIRHSQLQLPQELQNFLQGSGGTRDMHWWFTRDAVILDTAGAMFIQEGSTNAAEQEERSLGDLRWEEFLKLLGKNRKHCPINGLILVIPADKLITDTADEMGRKGREICRQLAILKERLDIRFPVFILVTKCDVIYGFREFFEDLRDPVLQQQLLGWSNPRALDEAFEPESLDDLLRAFLDRIKKRRLALLQEDVTPPGGSGRRTDDVDALFAFPESLAKVIPRLGRYLEMIFTAGPFSQRHLFLRGIYLNSSMRDGDALDMELAEALGVGVESLSEGRAWERDRSYFLRDMFTEKIFKEKGLVTRVANTRRHSRFARAALLTFGFAGVFAALGLTWYFWETLKSSIGTQSVYWQAAADQKKNWNREEPIWFSPVVFTELAGLTDYKYTSSVEVDGQEQKVSAFHAELDRLRADPITIPRVFAMASIGADFDEPRRRAQKALVETSIVRPLVEATRLKIMEEGADPAAWRPGAGPAWAELVRVQAQGLGLGEICAPACTTFQLPPLFAYVLARDGGSPEGAWDAYEKDHPHGEGLQTVLDSFYSGEDPQAQWPPPWLPEECGEAVQEGKNVLLGASAKLAFTQETGPGVPLALEVAEGAGRLLAAEGKVLEVGEALMRGGDLQTVVDGLGTEEAYAQFTGSWRGAFDEFASARDNFEKALRRADNTQIESIAGEYRQAAKNEHEEDCKKLQETAEASRERSLELLPFKPEVASQPLADRFTPEQAEFLSSFLDQATTAVDKSREAEKAKLDAWLKYHEKEAGKLEALDTNLLSAVEAKEAVLAVPEELRDWLRAVRKLFQLRGLMYATANKRLTDDAFKSDVAEGLDKCLDLAPEGYRCARTKEIASFICQVVDAHRIREKLAAEWEGLPHTCDAIKTRVQSASEELALPKIPFTDLGKKSVRPAFDPQQARALFGRWTALGDRLKEPGDDSVQYPELKLKYEDTKAEYTSYLQEYTEYWLGVAERLRVVSSSSRWEKFHKSLYHMSTDTIRGEGTSGLSGYLTLLDVAFALCSTQLKEPLPVEVARVIDRIARSRARLASTLLRGRCDDAKDAWSELERPAYDARRAILALTPYRFEKRFLTLVDGKVGPDYVSEYWHSLTMKLLQELTSAIETIGKQKAGELKELMRFPLAAPRPGEDPLTVEELLQARELLASIHPSTDQFPQGTIGSGKRTEIEEIDRQLQRICVPRVDQDVTSDWMAKAEAVLQALPTGLGDTFECRVFVVAADVQPKPAGAASRVSFIDVWRGMTMEQEGRPESRRVSTGQAEDWFVNGVRYPGGPLEFTFHKHDSFTTVAVDGPWACLRLLFEGARIGASRDRKATWERAERQQDGKSWHCRFQLVDDEREPRFFLIKLVFQKELPGIGDWPSE